MEVASTVLDDVREQRLIQIPRRDQRCIKKSQNFEENKERCETRDMSHYPDRSTALAKLSCPVKLNHSHQISTVDKYTQDLEPLKLTLSRPSPSLLANPINNRPHNQQ